MAWCVTQFGTLDDTGPHDLIGRGAIRRCGFTKVSMALLEEVCLVGAGFEVSYAQDIV